MAASYRLPSERSADEWATRWARQMGAQRVMWQRREASLAYRRANILRLLSGEPLDPVPAGIAPNYRTWAADLLRDIDRVREVGPAWIDATCRHQFHRRAYWLALLDATGHQRIRLRAIASGARLLFGEAA